MLDSLKQKKNFQRIKMRIKTGDLVKVINGKEKGKTGEVLKTIPLENRVVVKGINHKTCKTNSGRGNWKNTYRRRIFTCIKCNVLFKG